MAISPPSSSASPDGPRFVPGSTLAERYRIINLGGETFSIGLPLAVLVAVLSVFTLLRFGLLALVVVNTCASILTAFPLALDFSRWYAGRSLFAVAAILGMTFFGFRIALGNRPIFGPSLED